jgi:uncharacterized protein (DUF305 family)
LRETVNELRSDVTSCSALENPDHIFNDLLETYHERDPAMADQELSRGTDRHLRQLADSISRRTQRSLMQLEKVRQHRPGSDYRSTSPKYSHMMQQALTRGRPLLTMPVGAGTIDQK